MSEIRAIIAIVFALALLVRPGEAAADKIPGVGSAPFYYFSEEMDPIRVTFSTMRYDEPVPKPLTTIEIPRAYIYFASGYNQDEHETLPQEVKTKTLGILLTYPDGLPYRAAIRRDRSEHGGSQGLAGKKLRQVLIKAKIHASSDPAHDLYILRPREEWATMLNSETYLGEYEGLRRYTTGSTEYYYGDLGDELRKIRCMNAPEDANPVFYCEYYTVLNDRLLATVNFVDFRAHGGVEFARERMRILRRTVCPYFECDRVWDD